MFRRQNHLIAVPAAGGAGTDTLGQDSSPLWIRCSFMYAVDHESGVPGDSFRERVMLL
jgi:hypothetical protein